MSGPIFGNSAALGGLSGGNRHLVEFRAGRMTMVGKVVHPDTRKGLLYVYQADDSLIHFCWKDRTTNKVEDDLIIFPDDCEFKRVEQCKTGRVYILKFKSSSRRLFFWMQEPKNDKDDEWCRRINDVMNNPPAANSLTSSRGTGDNSEFQYMLNTMSQQQLMQLFGGVGQISGLSNFLGTINNRPSESSSRSGSQSSRTSGASTTISVPTTNTPATPTSVTSSAASAAPPAAPRKPPATSRLGALDADSGDTATITPQSKVTLTELQTFLSGLNDAGSAAGRTRSIDLSTVVNADALNIIADDKERSNALLQHLPTTGTNETAKKQLKDTISSPQFQQALSMFSSALQTGQLGPVVSQFDVNAEAVDAANSGDMEKFVKALEKNAARINSAKQNDDRDADKETPMEEDKNA